MKKVLSIIVPSYNSQDYLKRCVEYLLIGGSRVEILIVNDGSKDNTGKIAEGYQAQYPEIVRAIHQENGGHGEAVNTGIKRATGEYVKVVDSDDWVDPDAYEKILDCLASFTEPIDLLISITFMKNKGPNVRKSSNIRPFYQRIKYLAGRRPSVFQWVSIY